MIFATRLCPYNLVRVLIVLDGWDHYEWFHTVVRLPAVETCVWRTDAERRACKTRCEQQE